MQFDKARRLRPALQAPSAATGMLYASLTRLGEQWRRTKPLAKRHF